MAKSFQWIEFYMEFADKLLIFKNNRASLLKKIQETYSNLGMQLPTLERDDDGTVNNLKDIDPFTVYGLFNKGIKDETRIKIAKKLGDALEVKVPAPLSFIGIPIVDNRKATFL